MKLFICLCFMLMFLIPSVFAGVYQCTNAQGAVEFRDFPCSTSLDDQQFLPISYTKTPAKNAKLQQKKTAKIIQQKNKRERTELRTKNRLTKQKLKVEAKEKRRQERCVHSKEKIQLLEDQLKIGGTLKRFNRLKAELQHAETMKQRYCSSSS